MKSNELATQSKILETSSSSRKSEITPYEERSARYVDVLAQLKVNILHLEDLSGRLHYLMSEVRSVTRPR